MEIEEREKKIYRVTLMGSVVNVVLLVFKFVAGILGGSAAMIADAVHSLSDFLTDIVVIAFVRISSKPVDEDHDYGHGKYANTVGALKCGYYDPQTDSIVHVTDVNCGTDKDRDEWRDGLLDGSRKYGVIEVKCQQVTKNSLRHPVYMRYRQDKSYKMCTKDTVFEDKE